MTDQLLGHDRDPPWRDAYAAGLIDSSRLLVYAYPDYFEPRFVDGVYHEPHHWGVLDLATGGVEGRGTLPGYQIQLERTERSVSPAMIPFSHNGNLAAGDERVYVVPNDVYRVLEYDAEGVLLRDMRRSVPPVPVTEQDVQEWLDGRLAPFEGDDSPRVEAARVRFRALPNPDLMPVVTGLAQDASGNFWVREYAWPEDGPVRFAVLNPSGEYLGSVEMPAGLDGLANLESSPIVIGDDYVLGVWKDEFDVEQVRRYSLHK